MKLFIMRHAAIDQKIAFKFDNRTCSMHDLAICYRNASQVISIKNSTFTGLCSTVVERHPRVLEVPGLILGVGSYLTDLRNGSYGFPPWAKKLKN